MALCFLRLPLNIIPFTMTRPAVGTTSRRSSLESVVFPAHSVNQPEDFAGWNIEFKRSVAMTCQSLLEAASYSFDRFSRWIMGTGILFLRP